MAHPLSSITFESLGIKKPEKLISVTSKESIGSALSKMAQYNFLSVPVCSETDPRRFIAAVSGFDVIGLLVKDPQNHILEKPVDRLLTLDSEDESYRVWEVDVQDTLEKVGFFKDLFTDFEKICYWIPSLPCDGQFESS
jgi:CBS domain-containing protein